MSGFLGNFLNQKVEKASASLKQAVVEFDPMSASAAQIATIADAVRATNARLAELQQNLERAQVKVKADDAAVHQSIDAATLLSSQGKDAKAATVLDNVEKTLAPRLAQDRQDLADIEQSVRDFEARRGDLEGKLRTAQQRTDVQQRDLERARLQVDRAHEMEAQAKKDAGLLTAVSDLDVATDAMERATLRARAEADTAMRNARSLSGMASPDHGDADIAAAMQASAGTAKPAQSVADRLAALRATQAA